MDHSAARTVVCVWRLHVAKGGSQNKQLRDLSRLACKSLCTKVQKFLPSFDPHNPRMPVGLCGTCRRQLTKHIDDPDHDGFSHLADVEATLSAIAVTTRLATTFDIAPCSSACVPCSVAQPHTKGSHPDAPAGLKRGRPPTPEKATPPKSARVRDEIERTDDKQPDICVDSDDDIYGDALYGGKITRGIQIFYQNICYSSLLVPILLLVFMRKVQNLRVYTPTRIAIRARQGRRNGLES